MRLCSHLGRSLAYGCDNPRVSRAAADIAAHVFSDFRIVAGVTLFNARHRRHDLPWRTITALESVLFNEGGLHRMKLITARQTFDGGDRSPLDANGERQATKDPPTVNMNSAGAALSMIASLFGAGQGEMMSKGVEQSGAGINRQSPRAPIDLESYAGASIAVRDRCL
jgi:hypothetical protein